jgi:GT2 family glycosyltransferase
MNTADERELEARARVEMLAARLADKQRELSEVTGRASFRLAERVIRPVRDTLVPRGSRRERFARWFIKGIINSAYLAWRKLSGRDRALARRQRQSEGSGPPVAIPARYAEWIAEFEPDETQRGLQRTIAQRFPYRPLLSVVGAVFNPPPDVLRDMIASVLAQTYDSWQLVLVDGGSARPGVADVLAEAAAREPRITVVSLEANLGIAGNLNRGLEAARGEYVAFLDHDDVLAPDALYEAARLLNRGPSIDVVYFDEDKVSADGRTRMDPFFKPAHSPAYLLSNNYLMHSIMRRALVVEAGGLDSRFDGAQDWDLSLRLANRGARIVHIPKILYHWRKAPGSVASDPTAKMWAMEAQRPCLHAHLEQLGRRDVRIESPTLGVLRHRWAGRGARVSIIIPSRDNARLLERCIDSIVSKTRYPDYELIVVDTGSTQRATAELYNRLQVKQCVRLLHWDHEFNYQKVNNLGAQHATGEILVFLNDDIEVTDQEWLEELVRWAELPTVGCVGAKLLYPDGRVQHAGIVIGLQGHGSQIYRGEPAEHRWGPFGTMESYRNYLAVTGACLAMRRSVFNEVGGFDGSFELCYGDIDLCLRVGARGYEVVLTPFAVLTHHEGASRGLHFPAADVLAATVRMLPVVAAGDPCFSPNLSDDSLEPVLDLVNEPEQRVARVETIASSFGVAAELDHAIERELVGESAEWSRYAPLLERIRQARAEQPAAVVATAGTLRVLLTLHDLSRTGAPMVNLHLVRHLCANGHTVTVVSPKPGRMLEDFEEAGARVLIEPLVVGAPHAAADLFAAHNVVIANTILAWRTVMAARAAGRPALWIIHESAFGEKYVREHPSAVRALATADIVVYPSRETADHYRDFDGGNHAVVHYGLVEPHVDGVAFDRVPGRQYLVTVARSHSHGSSARHSVLRPGRAPRRSPRWCQVCR